MRDQVQPTAMAPAQVCSVPLSTPALHVSGEAAPCSAYPASQAKEHDPPSTTSLPQLPSCPCAGLDDADSAMHTPSAVITTRTSRVSRQVCRAKTTGMLTSAGLRGRDHETVHAGRVAAVHRKPGLAADATELAVLKKDVNAGSIRGRPQRATVFSHGWCTPRSSCQGSRVPGSA